MKKTFTKNEIPDISKDLVASFEGEEGKATVIALQGDLGAGKTTLTQAIARQLGVTENVISPTFIIMKNYPIKKGSHERLIHIDAYRLNSSQELLKLGWSELIADPKNLILIEWPERVPEILPENTRTISLSHVNEDERSITFK